MSFYRKYELARLVAEGDAKTFRAVEKATGEEFFLHLFSPAGLPVFAELKQRYQDARGNALRPLVEVGEFAGASYAVTEVLSPFETLREWLGGQEASAVGSAAESDIAAIRPASAPAAERELPPASSPAPVEGEFTRLFGQAAPPPAAPVAGTELAAPPEGEFTRLFGQAAPPPVAPMSGTELAAPPEGEFTRLFGQAAPPPTAPVAGTELAAPPEGEFTRLFGQAAPPPPAAAAVPLATEADDFDAYFGSGLKGKAVDVDRQAAQASPPAARPFQPAGEFTRRFGSPVIPPRDAAPLQLNTSASGIFGPASSLGTTPAAPAGEPSGGEPGEYTRIIRGLGPAEQDNLAPAPATAASLPAKPKLPLLTIVFSAAGVLVVVVLLVFLLTVKRG